MCNYHLTRGLHQTTVAADIKTLFDSLNVTYNEPTVKNFLQRLGVMHLAAVIGASAKCQSNIGLSTFYNRIRKIYRLSLNYTGLPANWAFTICRLFHLVHFDLIRKRRYEDAALLFNFIWKAYAYKLKEAKRIAFMANLFAGLHYDYSPDNNLNMVKNMGTYILKKFTRATRVPEYRVYVTVVWLCMADIQKQETRDDLYLSVILQAEIEDFSVPELLQEIWNSIKYYSALISENIQYNNFYNTRVDEIFHEGWRVAFGKHRFLSPESVKELKLAPEFTPQSKYSDCDESLIKVERTSFNVFSSHVFILIYSLNLDETNSALV